MKPLYAREIRRGLSQYKTAITLADKLGQHSELARLQQDLKQFENDHVKTESAKGSQT